MAKPGKAPKPSPEEVQIHRQECVDLVCAAISSSDKGLKRVCDAFRVEDPSFPPARTLRDWIANDNEFATRYARAKELQADHIFEQIIEIADDDTDDELFVGGDDESGAGAKRVQNSEFIARSKLKVDARKWVVSKLVPKKYGDKVVQEVTGPDGGPQEHIVASVESAEDFNEFRALFQK